MMSTGEVATGAERRRTLDTRVLESSNQLPHDHTSHSMIPVTGSNVPVDIFHLEAIRKHIRMRHSVIAGNARDLCFLLQHSRKLSHVQGDTQPQNLPLRTPQSRFTWRTMLIPDPDVVLITLISCHLKQVRAPRDLFPVLHGCRGRSVRGVDMQLRSLLFPVQQSQASWKIISSPKPDADVVTTITRNAYQLNTVQIHSHQIWVTSSTLSLRSTRTLFKVRSRASKTASHASPSFGESQRIWFSVARMVGTSSSALNLAAVLAPNHQLVSLANPPADRRCSLHYAILCASHRFASGTRLFLLFRPKRQRGSTLAPRGNSSRTSMMLGPACRRLYRLYLT